MRKLMIIALSCLLLAGCNDSVEGVAEMSFTTESETSAVTSFTETELSETTTVSTEINEEILDTGTTVIESDDETAEFVGVAAQGEDLPDNAVVYEYDSSNIPELTEFTMDVGSIFGEYERERILTARLEIKAILECAITGNTPIIKRNGYDIPIPKLENISIGSYEIVGETYDPDSGRYEVTAELDVTESFVEEIPVGKAQYAFINEQREERSYMPLRRTGEYDALNVLPDGYKVARFCNDFTAYFSDFFEGDDVADFSSPDVSHENFPIFYALMTARWYHPDFSENIPYDVFDSILMEMYGFSADSLGTKETSYYRADTDTVYADGRGIGWLCGYLAEKSYDEETRTYTITIDYYEDEFYLVKSQTYRYTVRENENGSFTMLRMERLFKSDRGILGGCT